MVFFCFLFFFWLGQLNRFSSHDFSAFSSKKIANVIIMNSILCSGYFQNTCTDFDHFEYKIEGEEKC